MAEAAVCKLNVQDLRRHVRRQLVFYFPALHGDGQVLGNVIDLTTDGMQLACPRAIEPGDSFELEIQVRDNGAVRPISIAAECRWCRPGQNPALFDAGFRINPVSVEDERRWQQLMSEHTFDQFCISDSDY